MGYQAFIPILRSARLSDRQVQNVSRLIESSLGFSRELGIDAPEYSPAMPDVAVIESGHQPNFLPYPGIFKKIFLVDTLVSLAREEGIPAIGFFGFADQNLSTAPVLSSNRIPFLTRDGFEKIGFKVPERDRWRQFRCIASPSRDEWRKKMDYFENHYLKAYRELREPDGQGAILTKESFGTLDSCHERAGNFADLNASLIARISTHHLGIRNVLFFRYSDVQADGIFLEEATRIATRREEFVSRHNEAISLHSLQDLGGVDPAHVPFWCHCKCGRKLEIRAEQPRCWTARCEGCGEGYSFTMDEECHGLAQIHSYLGYTAISRNLIFSEGLGVSLFISGTGGSLRYGKISDHIGKAIGFRVPCTGAWGGRDYYLGPIQRKALLGLKQVFSLGDAELSDGALGARISSALASFSRDLQELGPGPETREERKKRAGTLTNARTQVGIATKLFSLSPSMLDLLVSIRPEEILSSWRTTVHTGTFMQDTGVVRLQDDCFYPSPRGLSSSLLPGIREALAEVGSVP